MNPYTFPGLPEMNTDADTVKRVIAKEFGISIDAMMSRSRVRSHSTARHVFCYIMRQYTDMRHREIGDMIGRDHSSVIHAVKNIAGLIEVNTSVKEKVERIKQDLK